MGLLDMEMVRGSWSGCVLADGHTINLRIFKLYIYLVAGPHGKETLSSFRWFGGSPDHVL